MDDEGALIVGTQLDAAGHVGDETLVGFKVYPLRPSNFKIIV